MKINKTTINSKADNMIIKNVFAGALIIASMSCTNNNNKLSKTESLMDKDQYKNTETQILYNNLKKLGESKNIMFGIANPVSINYLGGPKNYDTETSDCKDITGSHPAYHESDLMWYSDISFKRNDIMAMKKAYNRGAVIGYCWHMRGRNSHSFYNTENGEPTNDKYLVKEILELDDRQKNHALDWYLSDFDSVAIPVFNELDCPIVFRPLHEMNGGWFWWGNQNCTPDEYIKLFRLTVDYLRSKNIDNLLIAWSVNVDADFNYYPGNEYVDILGLDSYEPGIAPWNPVEKFVKNLAILANYAKNNGKVAALTETGCRKDNNGNFTYPDMYPEFWTNNIVKPILADSAASKIAWIMSWYGGDWKHDEQGQIYTPYKGMNRPNSVAAIADFIDVYNNNNILFENNLPAMYK